jgi:hypothetical protein
MSTPFPSLATTTETLAVPGSFWAGRSERSQKPLIRQMSLLAGYQNRAGRLAGAADWLNGGPFTHSGVVAWKPDPEEILVQGTGTWGVATPVFPDRKASDHPVKAKGLGVIPAGYTAVEQPAGYRAGYLVWPEGSVYEGGPVFYSSGIPVEAGTQVPSNRVLSLFTPDREAVIARSGSYTIVSEALENATPFVLPDVPGMLDVRVEFGTSLSEETVWFVKVRGGIVPDILYHSRGWLARGSGFIEASGWIALYENPLTLWSDGIITGYGGRRSQGHPRGFAVGDTGLSTAGIHITRFRAADSGTVAFGRALAEIAGLRILDAPAVVTDIHKAAGRFVHRLEGGGTLSLPAATPYVVGDTIPAGSGHLLHVRTARSHGPGFCAGRPWSAIGFDISAVYPQFGGFSIRDEFVETESVGGISLPLFNQNPAAEAEWRAWYRGRRQFMDDGLDSLAAFGDILNPLTLFSELLADRLLVVETPLQWVDPAAHARVRDFIERERPAGAIVVMPAWPAPVTYDSGVVFQGYQLMVGDSVLVWA